MSVVTENMNLVKPEVLKVIPENLPDSLKNLNIWVLWGWEWKPDKDGGGKWSKVPLQPRGAHEDYREQFGLHFYRAKTSEPKTWSGFDTVMEYLESFPEHFAGVGVVLKADLLCGGDLDNSVVDGTPKEWAQKIVDRMDTYTEISPSRTGLKYLHKGSFEMLRKSLCAPTLRFRKQYHDGVFETYDCESSRFFTLTGHHLVGTPREVMPRQQVFEKVYAQIFRSEIDLAIQTATVPPKPAPCDTTQVEDQDIINLIRESKQADKFDALWSGNTAAYGEDHSAADLALATVLAFWCGPDPERIDALFRRSALYREKWDRDDYRERTIIKAIDSCEGEFYDHGVVDPDLDDVISRHEPAATPKADKAEAAVTVYTAPDYEPCFDETPEPRTYDEDDLLSLLDLKRKAESVSRVWIAENWLQAGHLSVLSGREKRGKSTSVYDLITALLTGEKWMGHIPTTKCPVLLLDYENPVDFVWGNLQRMLDARGADYEEISNWYGQIDPDKIKKSASPLLAEMAINRIQRMTDRTGAQHGLVVVDTAAPAWMEMFEDPTWTNTNTQVRKALDIGREITRKTGWHVLVLYHDNKSGTGAAGSYEWYGTPDVFLRFERDLGDPKGYLSIFGRLLEPPAPIEFIRQGNLLQAQKIGTEKATQDEQQYRDQYAQVLFAIPNGEAAKLKQIDIVNKCKDLDEKLSRNVVLNILANMEERKDVITHRDALNKPKFYWRD